MLSAFARLAAITVGSVMVIFFAVVFVRWMGFQQGFAPPPHPWFEQSYWNIYEPKDVCSKYEQPPPQSMIFATIFSREGEWLVECPAHLPLDQVLKSSAHPNWVLHVRANDSANLDKLVEIVGSHDANKKFAFAGDSQRASRFLRKKGPQWLFAADAASLLRMQLFTSMWIETAMDFWPDFVIAGNDATLPTHLNDRVAAEIIRRQKRIVWFADENPVIPIQGRVTKNPRP